MMIRNFSELNRLKTFKERFEYLKLIGQVASEIFGEERMLNQRFYKSVEWGNIRTFVITRDRGLDLGCKGYDILGRIVVHHMNPVIPDDLIHGNPEIIDPEFLITVSVETHLAIHYGDPNMLPRLSMERRPGDTRLW